ncbi:NUDIX domain-containing protein [Streptomyces sp. NPDC049881]|uniref:NUDIX hydrolase n=1 Tax=Streptomyces sp. NPDC049881 TaxID=3155778 RepID=UPI003448CB9D
MPYDPSDFPPFAVTVDLVVLTVRRHALCALTVRRGEEPYRGQWALPGGFVRTDEDLATAAARELAEETGLRTNEPGSGHSAAHLEQLATYGDPDRDPRMRVVSVAHLVLAPDLPAPTPGGDAGGAQWTPVGALLDEGGARGAGDAAAPSADTAGAPADSAVSVESGTGDGSGGRSEDGTSGPPAGVRLAFDHGRILADGVERARSKIEYSSLAAAFCPPEFTVGELRRVYEAVWGVVLDPRNFHRKVTGTPGFLVPVGGTTTRQGGRPAQLFRAGGATVLNPPMLRPEV